MQLNILIAERKLAKMVSFDLRKCQFWCVLY